MPGVVRVFTAADVPGNRGTGLNDPDQPVFVAEGEITCCVADFLAMVVADTPFHARQAAAHVDDRLRGARADHRPVRARSKPGAPLVHSADTFAPRPSNVLQPMTAFSRGDVDAALATAAHVIEATFDTQPIDIAFLEPEACLAVPQRRRRQGPHARARDRSYDHAQIARVLNLDPGGRRDRARRERRRVRREGGTVDSGDRRRWPRTCCSGRSRPCSRASSRRSTTSSATR